MDKQTLLRLMKYAPLVLGVVILLIGALFVPWRDVVPYFSRLELTSYIAILVLGVAFYIARVARYHYMLQVMNTPLSFTKTIVAYFTAQPIALLPAGEAYRVVTLNEHGNVPKSKGVSIVFIQSFTENVALVLLALISAIILNQYVLIIFVLLLLYIAILLFVRTRHIAEKSHGVITKLPFVNIARTKVRAFINRNKMLLSGKSFVVLLISGFASSLIASLLLFIIANDIGIHIDFTHAMIAFTLPTVLQNISLLPGGIGVNEQGTVGILLILGATLPAAVALTLIMRFVTLGLGIIIGLLVSFIAKMK